MNTPKISLNPTLLIDSILPKRSEGDPIPVLYHRYTHPIGEGLGEYNIRKGLLREIYSKDTQFPISRQKARKKIALRGRMAWRRGESHQKTLQNKEPSPKNKKGQP